MTRALPFLLALCSLCLGGCPGQTSSTPPIVPALDTLPKQAFPMDEAADRWHLEVVDGRLPGLAGKRSELPAGSLTFNVVNRVEGARADIPGLDLSEQAIALWLRGRGPARHLLPQHSIGPVNAGVQEDWQVELPPGDYLLSVTMGGDAEATLSVR